MRINSLFLPLASIVLVEAKERQRLQHPRGLGVNSKERNAQRARWSQSNSFQHPRSESERDEQIQALLSARFGAEGETIWLRQLQFAVWKII
jgi:hypothetical protein